MIIREARATDFDDIGRCIFAAFENDAEVMLVGQLRADKDVLFEQVRTRAPAPSFTPARPVESRALSLPPANWLELYDRTTSFIAPNKVNDKP